MQPDQDSLRLEFIRERMASGISVEQIEKEMLSLGLLTPEPRLPAAGRGTRLDVRKSNQWAKDNAPIIGAALATAATGGGALPLIAAATTGGAGGSLLRGDNAEEALKQGALQGVTQAGTMGVGKLMQLGARALMRAKVPAKVASDFLDDVDVPQAMLDEGVVPGSAASRARIQNLLTAANRDIHTAAANVPQLSRSRVINDLRPIYRKMVMSHEPEMADVVLQHMRNSARNIGPGGLSGAEALARKETKTLLGKAALNAADPRMAALGPQLNNIERKTITSHLRDTPEMADALDKSQKFLALKRVMDDAAVKGNPLNRLSSASPIAATQSPIGMALTAHALNKSAGVVPDVARLLHALMNQRSQDE